MKLFHSLPCLTFFLLTCAAGGQSFVMPSDFTEIERKRFAPFAKFQIRGVCGIDDLARLAGRGVNTVRGYTIPEPSIMRKDLDEVHRLGMKMIVSEWMPHHGENKGKDGSLWTFDYQKRGDEMLANLLRKVEAIGDHPAILMWGLGNEVHLDEPYLRLVNRMSLGIHARFPHHVTSLTMINAKREAIEAVKRFAPDVDVLGIQSYSRGAVLGGIRNAENFWGKPFYMSEFNTNGPWNFRKNEWGVEVGEPATNKVRDLIGCYDAIDASSLCLGSTIFVWAPYSVGDRPTYFSLLLDPTPEKPRSKSAFEDLLVTPQADVMTQRFTGKPPVGNRAPVLSKLEFSGGADSLVVRPGEEMQIHFAAEDPDRDRLQFVSWILEAKAKHAKVVEGPFSGPSLETATIKAPETPGEYLLMVYAKDGNGGASAGTVAFKVPEVQR